MPGGPPYPGPLENAPQQPQARTPYLHALGASAVWAGVNLVIALAVNVGARGLAPSGRAIGAIIGGCIIPMLIASLAVWLITRRRRWSFVRLVFLALPFFFVVRLVLGAASVGAGS
jgi:hypothetical protein